MKYAIVEVKGMQYRVQEGDKLTVPFLYEKKEGEEIILDKILFYREGEDIRIGQPYLEGIRIKAKILEHYKLPKIIVFKFKRKKNYRRKYGHRQRASKIEILEFLKE